MKSEASYERGRLSSMSVCNGCSLWWSVTSGLLAVTEEIGSVQLSFCACGSQADRAKVPASPVIVKQLMFVASESASLPLPSLTCSTCPKGCAEDLLTWLGDMKRYRPTFISVSFPHLNSACGFTGAVVLNNGIISVKPTVGEFPEQTVESTVNAVKWLNEKN